MPLRPYCTRYLCVCHHIGKLLSSLSSHDRMLLLFHWGISATIEWKAWIGRHPGSPPNLQCTDSTHHVVEHTPRQTHGPGVGGGRLAGGWRVLHAGMRMTWDNVPKCQRTKGPQGVKYRAGEATCRCV